MSNTFNAVKDQLADIAARTANGGAFYPNPDDPNPWPWPIGPIVREAWKVSLLDIIARRYPEIYDYTHGGGPIWSKNVNKEIFARAIAKETVSNALNIAYTAEGKAEAAAKYVEDVTDELCPRQPKFPRPHHFDALEQFIIGQEFRNAAAAIENGALKSTLQNAAGRLFNAATSNDAG